MTEKRTFREAVERAHIKAVAEDQRAWIAHRDGGPAPPNYSREVAFLKSLEAQGWKITGPEMSEAQRIHGGWLLAKERGIADVYGGIYENAPTVTDLMGDER